MAGLRARRFKQVRHRRRSVVKRRHARPEAEPTVPFGGRPGAEGG